MANELIVQNTVTFIKGAVDVRLPTRSKSNTISGDNGIGQALQNSVVEIFEEPTDLDNE
jgi:hypothetical protein